MNDPFFDEDDGEFGDLYGNPPPSTFSPAVRQKARNKEVPETHPATTDGQLLIWSPVASSSVVSTSHLRDRIGSNTTDLAAAGKQDTRRKKRGKLRQKGSQELFDVQWESDVEVDKCGLCKSDFSLVRRKHHCRHCGRIMCSDCSSFLYFEHSRRKHRVCYTCNNQLLAEQAAYERQTMTVDNTTSNLIADSSDGGRPAPSARTSRPNTDNKNVRKKTEENLRKELKNREKSHEQGGAGQGLITATTFWNQANVVGNQLTANGAAVFDSSDEDWFTDVPDQQIRSRDSVEVYSVDGSVDGDSKGSGWRDRVKDTYTVTPSTTQTSVVAPTAGSLLSAGIIGKNDISDQFRYDVSGPGLGHDDDISLEMPRPKQPIATSTHTDRSVKPSGLTGNGYSSGQFQYDDAGGPGLSHDDNSSVSMPRSKQQLAITPYSHKSARHSQKQLEPNSTDDSTFYKLGFQARPTFTGMAWQESTAKKRGRIEKASIPQARGNHNITLDDLNSLQDGSRTLGPAVPNVATTKHTFYDQDADELLVDESPGYFEATMEEREAQRKKEEEQYAQLARDITWANNSSLPTTVQPHYFPSEQDSYSIVNISSHTVSSPIGDQRGDAKDTGASGKTKSSFTGALKRFLGMRSKKTTTPPKPAKIPPKPAKTPRAAVIASPEKDVAENHTSPNYHDSTITTDSDLGGLVRHTVVDYYGVNRAEPVPQAHFRNTLTPYVDSNSRVGKLQQHHQEQDSERKRRGTFDELFMSPEDNLAIDNFSDRFSTGDGSGWAARVEETTNAGPASFGAVGVARFDQRRPVDKAEEFVLGNGPVSVVLPAQPVDHSTEAWRESAVLSLLNDKKVTAQSEELGFTWSNMGPASGLGTEVYAMLTSLQPRAVYSNNTGVPTQFEAPATLGSIMDDLKYDSASKKSQGKESIDDLFAEFEETNDYVFDSATGGYVPARGPARAMATRNVKQLKSTEMLVPEKLTPNTSDHGYNNPSPIAGTIVATNGNGEDVEDNAAEIIVDKISSLESELAALKQLIRIRKGNKENQSSKPRVNRSTAKPSFHKESIFDNGSSDEDHEKNALYASSVRPAGSKRRPGSKKKFVKTRKDYFADLFENNPSEHKVFGGATSYEALFQTEERLIERSKEDASDDDVNSIQRPKSGAAKLRRSDCTTNDFVLSNDSDFELKPTLLKESRGKLSYRRKTREVVDDGTSLNMNEGKLVTSPLRLGVKQGRTSKQVEEDDPIDALFDSSNDHDVAKLYGGDDGHDGENVHSVLESSLAPVLKSKSVLLNLEPSSDAEASGSPAAVIESNITDSPTKGIRLELSLLCKDLDLTVNDVSAEHTIPTALLADASLSWMSAGALENEAANKSLISGELKSQSVHEVRHMTESAIEAVITNEDKQDDGADIALVPASTNPATVYEAVPSLIYNKAVLTKEVGGSVERLPLANLALVEESSGTNEKVVRQDNAVFNIFDKSGDVEFSSISSPMDLKTADQEEVGNDSENDGKESVFGNDEAFSFEIQAPKKRSSADVLTTISSVQSVSHYSESSSASVDDGVEFGKYAAFPALPSSCTPLIDSSLDDPEDIMVDDDSVLGKVESQAFNTDWQQMQVEEKERKKRLQVKHRQAQRDKLLRKQASAKPLSGSNATHGSNIRKLKSGKKKKKEKEKDDAALSSLHHKKSGSSRKYRQNATDSASLTPRESPRLLTEL